MKKKALLEMYHELKEGGTSTSDFPLLLGNLQHKALLSRFKAVANVWRSYVKIGDLSDFKSHRRIILAESPDLVAREEKGPYEEGSFQEDSYDIALKTKGRTWSVTREMIINDDLGGLRDFGDRAGRAAARTIAKEVTELLQSNPTAYDGNPLFDETNHSNVGHTALTADRTGIETLDSAVVSFMNQTDPRSGELIDVEPWGLLGAPATDMTRRWLVSQTEVRDGSSGTLTSNPMTGRFVPITDRRLTAFTARWYLIARPTDMHFLEVGFLNGVEEPALLVKSTTSTRLSGGEDPYDFEFDEIEYKVRHDWAIAAAYYQAIYGGNQ